MFADSIHIRHFSTPERYETTLEQMQTFTSERTPFTPDALWFLEHPPVFTQGQAGKKEHVLRPGAIPIVQSDRGGQITYHGPGQLIIYALFDLKRSQCGIKLFTHALQDSIIQLLEYYGIQAHCQPGAPGVYIEQAKISSIGLRVRQGCTYHGMSLNVNMDLSPFERINPCGIPQLRMTQISDFISGISLKEVMADLSPLLVNKLVNLEK